VRKRYVKAVALTVALVILAVEGYFLYGRYNLYYDDGIAAVSAVAPEARTLEGPARPETNDVAFVHHTTDKNSQDDSTYLNDPSINGDPNAVILVTPNPKPGSTRSNTYDHYIGVRYDSERRKWAIFDQDRSAVPIGTTFKVVVPQAPREFIHRATLENTIINGTYLDNPLINGNPKVDLSVTPNWNPGGGAGIFNDHPTAVAYDADTDRWLIYNKDLAPIKEDVAFNVRVELHK
jgi:hypothetical protein